MVTCNRLQFSTGQVHIFAHTVPRSSLTPRALSRREPTTRHTNRMGCAGQPWSPRQSRPRRGAPSRCPSCRYGGAARCRARLATPRRPGIASEHDGGVWRDERYVSPKRRHVEHPRGDATIAKRARHAVREQNSRLGARVRLVQASGGVVELVFKHHVRQ